MKLHVINLVKGHLIYYLCPININFLWNYGFLLGIVLVIQIFTGILLSTSYTADVSSAYYSVQIIQREIWSGWCFKYMHAIGASFIFILVYLHILRGLNYSFSYLPLSWNSGLIIFLLFIVTAFMGYVLPWGQMSFWGATVITNLLYFIPGLIDWVCGGFIINNPTLKRFFILHFLFPFITIYIVIIHIFFLHIHGSTNPLGYDTPLKISFFPSLLTLDIKGMNYILVLFLFQCLFGYIPLAHPDNSIPVNRYQTPQHIVPEWYFLAFYAIIKTIPNKTSGLLIMLASLQVLFLLSEQRNLTNMILFKFRYGSKDYSLSVIWFICTFYAQMCIGAQLPQNTYLIFGSFFIMLYFVCILFLLVKNSRTNNGCSSQAHISFHETVMSQHF